MHYRQPNFENPFQPQVSESVQGAQQPYAMPGFEASRAPSQASQAPQSREQQAPRALSPFEVQWRTIGSPLPFATRQGQVQQGQAQQPPLLQRQVGQPQVQQPQTQQPQAQQPQAQQPTAPLQQFPTPQLLASTPAQRQFAFASTPSVGSPQLQALEGVGTRQGTPTPQTASPQPSQSPSLSPESFGMLGQGVQAQTAGRQSPRQPPLDIHDAGDELEIEIELPGVSKKNIRLVSQPRGLELRATAQERQTDDLVQSERGQRVFQRSIPVGFEVDPKKVKAKFKNGILTVSVPKDAAKSERTIDIN